MLLLRNTKIGIKMTILIVLAILALVINSLVTMNSMSKINTEGGAIYSENVLPIKWLNTIIANKNKINSDIFELMITEDSVKNQMLVQDMNDLLSLNDLIFGDYLKTKLDPIEQTKSAQYQEAVKRYTTIRQIIVDLGAENKNVDAYAMYLNTLKPIDDQINQILTDLSNFNANQADEVGDKNDLLYSNSLKLSIALVLGSVLVFILFGYFITRIITKPIKAIQQLMYNAANGDLTVQGNYVSKDEVGLLTKSFNMMVEGLRNLLKQVNDNSLSLSAMSEELSASVEQAGQAASNITESIQEVATGADNQLVNVRATEQTIDQMSHGIQSISDYSQQVSEKATRASDSAVEGKQAIEKSVQQMNTIKLSVGNASRSIFELGEQAQHIGTIIETISGIAKQTNLLALNAAIEAARVGEQGRGFTVVSNEIRKLAEQSAYSAKQIAEYVQSLRTKMEAALNDMEIGTKEVADGTVVMNNVSQSFDLIYSAINEVTSQIDEITGSVNQIAVGTEEVVHSFGSVSAIASVSSAETQTVSAATEEQLASMEEIAATANSLSHMAEELQTCVNQFKI